MASSLAGRKSATIASEDQPGPSRCDRSMGSSHPAKADTILRHRSHEKTVAKLQTRVGCCVAVVALGLVFAQRNGDRVGTEHQFAPDGLFKCKPCVVR